MSCGESAACSLIARADIWPSWFQICIGAVICSNSTNMAAWSHLPNPGIKTKLVLKNDGNSYVKMYLAQCRHGYTMPQCFLISCRKGTVRQHNLGTGKELWIPKKRHKKKLPEKGALFPLHSAACSKYRDPPRCFLFSMEAHLYCLGTENLTGLFHPLKTVK